RGSFATAASTWPQWRGAVAHDSDEPGADDTGLFVKIGDEKSAASSKIVNIPQPRRRLANRRASENFDLEIGGLKYTATVSRFPDGRVAEIFLQNHKTNSSADVNARDAAIACSFALQFGADVETIRKALCRDASGRASG